MEVILLERIEKLGQMGDIVKVKPGFARNFLLPQKKALRATKDNLTHFEHQRAELEASNLSEKTEAEAAASKMEGLSLVLIRSASEAGHLYGSVSARDIAEALAENSVTVQRRQVELAAPIKTLGLHEARVRLHPEVAVTVVLNVAQSEDEARTQAAHLAPAVEEAAPEAAAEAVVEAAEEVAEASITEEVAEEFFEEPGAATEGGADDEAEKPA